MANRLCDHKEHNGRRRASPGVYTAAMTAVWNEYLSLNTEEARVAFAGSWIEKSVKGLENTWPMFYELLRLTSERELYRQGWFLKDGRTFGTFREFFEAVVKQPFERWAELEATYQFVTENAPECLAKPYGEAVKARTEAAERQRAAAAATTGEVLPRYQHPDVQFAHQGVQPGPRPSA